MKKKIEVEIAAIPATTRVVEKVYCDIPNCIDEVRPGSYGWGKTSHQCCICNRDICKRHTVDDPDDGGDYPDRWCTICASLYSVRRREMQDRHWKEEEELLDKVKKQSLNHG